MSEQADARDERRNFGWGFPERSPLPRQREPDAPPTDAVLWGRIHTATDEQMDQRILALAQLAQHESPELPAYLADQLERNDLKPPWRDALVVTAEKVLFPELEHRTRVASSLRRLALALRDDPASEQVLCAAVWRYTTLIPREQIGTLLDFLRPEDRVLTWQVTLQSISNAFSRRLPDPCLPLDDVRSRVEHLTEHHIAEAEIGTAECRALAISLYCAVAALGSAKLGVMTERLVQLDRRSMVRRAHQLLEPVERAWTAVAPAGESTPAALVALREALMRLSTAMHTTRKQSSRED